MTVAQARLPLTASPTMATTARHVASESDETALAFRLYLCFMVSWFLHLPARIPVLGLVRADLLLVLCVAGLTALNARRSEAKTDSRISTRMLVLIGYSLIVTPFVEWPGTVVKISIPELIKALIFYYFTAQLVTTKKRLAKLIAVFVLCQVFRAIEPLYLNITQGYWGSAASMSGGSEFMERLSGAPSDVVNPNGLAFVILTVIPFAHYVWSGSRIGTLIYLLTLGPLTYALLLTGSRSGLVSLVALFGVIWLKSRHKILLSVIGVGAVLVAPMFMTPDQIDRYESIVSADTKNRATADERVDGFTQDLQVGMRRPIFGHGLGTSKEANVHFSGRNFPAHNLFTQVFQELGIVGIPVFFALIIAIVQRVWRCLATFKRSASSDRFLMSVIQAVQVWLIMNIVFSFFSYGLSSYEWYFMAGLAEAITLLSTDAGGRRALMSSPVQSQFRVPKSAIRAANGRGVRPSVRLT